MHRLAGVAVLLTLAGCTVGPKYKRPVLQPPDKYYTDTAPQATSIADLPWWELFRDPVLRNLILEALKNNYDVNIAAARVEQARAQAGVARSLYFPQIGYGAGVTTEKYPTPLIRNNTYYSYAASLSWEIDLWGRIRKLNEQQRALFFASLEAQRGVWLSLVSDVAQAYFELRALDASLTIARQTGQSFQESFDLFNKKLEGGAGSALETSRAEGALANVQAQISDLERLITAKENQISLLLGKNPGPIARGVPLSAQYDPSEVPAGLPSTLLERRPDVRQAEQQLVAANAAVGVAKADFFPVLNLTGLLGGVSPQLSQLVDSGKLWSAGAGLTGPLFTGGRLKNQYKLTRAQRDEFERSYQQLLTQAFGEVSSALVSHQKLAHAITEEKRSVTAYQQAVHLANTRYDNGLSSYFEVLDAKLQLYPAENALVQFDLQRKIALVALYKALGGGWKLNDLDWIKSATAAGPGTVPTSTSP